MEIFTNIIKQYLSFFLAIIVTVTMIMLPVSSNESYGATKKKTKKVKKYKVVRIIDGDTIVIKKGGKKVKVRMIGVDTPESVHSQSDKNVPYGKIAAKYTKKKLKGKKVRLKYDKEKYDRYDRLLAYVYIKKKMFNKMLLARGHAKTMTRKPNTKHYKAFKKIEKKAKKANKGLWKYENQNAGSYIGLSTTKKLHYSKCSYLSSAKKENLIQFKTRTDAINLGYEPCKVCKP